MSMIKSYAAKAAGSELELYEYDAGELKPEDVEVQVDYCGICHSDLSMIDNEWGFSQYPLVAGHEVIGRVAALGSAAQDKGLKVGQRVGVGWTARSCGHCDACISGNQINCLEGSVPTILNRGGFAEKLRAITQYIGDNAKSFQNQYGNISSASVGAIQRGLLSLEQQGAAHFFGEPMLDIKDWMRTDANGKGMINILSAEKLYQMPKLYAASLLWMLSELYEQLPEAGDLEKPKLVFFFDEAHLLFNDAPQVLLDKIEQVIRLIRSKGVGVWFVSQNPSDIPDNVLGQLGNRVQHALRAFTPKDQKAVKSAAQTMRANPAFDTEKAIQELGTGEALVSFLDAKGSPSVVERAMVIAPCSRMGPVTDDERNGLINHSSLYGKYEEEIDRESAYERLQQGVQASTEQQNTPPANGKAVDVDGGILGGLKDILFGSTGPRGGKRDGVVQSVAKSAARQVTNQIIRGMLGSLMGGRKR